MQRPSADLVRCKRKYVAGVGDTDRNAPGPHEFHKHLIAFSHILLPFRSPKAAVLQLPVGGGGCDSQPWRQPGAGDCNCLPSSRAASACSGAGTLLVPWLFLFRRLLDLVPLWQFTAFGSSCVYQLQRLHALTISCPTLIESGSITLV